MAIRRIFISMFIAAIVLQSGFISVVTIVAIKQHKALIKSKMKAELRSGKHNADLVVFTEQDLKFAKWEHSKEFFLGDGKYDVVRTEITKDGKIYHCVNDTKEIELYKNLDTHGKQKSVFEDIVKKFTITVNKEQFSFLQVAEFENEFLNYQLSHYKLDVKNKNLRPPSDFIL